MATTMAKKKPVGKPGERKRYPSRENTRYVALPLALYEVLEVIGLEEDRSISWLARKAVREFLERHGRMPSPKTKE